MPDDDMPANGPEITPDATSPVLRPRQGVLVEHEVSTYEMRMLEIENSPDLADSVLDDADENLFSEFDDTVLDQDFDDDEDNEPLPVVNRSALFEPNVPHSVAMAGQHEVGNHGNRLLENRQDRPDAGNNGVVAVAVQPVWKPIFELPGYGARNAQGQAVRALGRSIFRSFPCFRLMEEECRAAGRDPLGEVQVMFDIGGREPRVREQINAMASWINQNGMAIDAGQIEFPRIMPGYRPEIMLATSRDESFLMVHETPAGGAQMESFYIYTWRGGHEFYNNNDQAHNALQNMGGPQSVRLRGQRPEVQPALLASPVREIQEQPANPAQRLAIAAPAHAQQVEVALLPDAQVAENPPAGQRKDSAVGVSDGTLPERAQKGASATTVPARVNPMQIMQTSGFVAFGTPEGPARRRELEDGSYLVVRGEGRSLALASTYKVAYFDAFHTEISSAVLDSASAVVEWGDACVVPVHRP